MKCLKYGLMIAVLLFSSAAFAQFEYFRIRSVTEPEFYKFIKVFSEMRGPLRQEILKDKNANFEEADPLEYVSKVKDEKDVKKALKDNDLTWDQFNEIMGNILLGYFSIQPNKTKAALVRQLAGYDMMVSMDQVPEEYRDVVKEVAKTEEGSQMAAMVLELVIQIPEENVGLAKKNSRKLDQMFYTRFWRDKL